MVFFFFFGYKKFSLNKVNDDSTQIYTQHFPQGFPRL